MHTISPAKPSEPEPDTDAGDVTSTDEIHWYNYGRLLYTGDRSSFRDFLQKQNFFPNVFIISDHGNSCLIHLWEKTCTRCHQQYPGRGRAGMCPSCTKRNRNLQRRERDGVLRDLGLVKVRGCVSGKTYWE